MQQLGLEGKNSTLSLTTLETANALTECSIVNLDLNEEHMVELPKVFSRSNLPISRENVANQLDVDRWPHPRGIEIPSVDAEVGLLIGSDVPEALQPREVRRSRDGGPFATRTIFGWVINGPLGRKGSQRHIANFVQAVAQLNQQFQQFCNREFNDSIYETKMSRRGRTNVKRYGVLFTCLSIRAIHIEVAHSLDTKSFINALRRFVSRRGTPEEIRSDNGGNFVKGEKELRKAIEGWNQQKIQKSLLQKDIKCIFNPPAGSHHGGVWERCIRTVRKVFSALIKEQTMDNEGISTLLCEVESIVNGRPITNESDDPRDLEALTPNHLLLLHPGSSIPPGRSSRSDNSSMRRWRQVQYLADLFWRRWLREYLPSLQQRQKWNKLQRNVEVNDIVLVLDEKTFRCSWPLGRVLEVHTNKEDGLVRSAKIKTITSVMVRPISNLTLLEQAHER